MFPFEICGEALKPEISQIIPHISHRRLCRGWVKALLGLGVLLYRSRLFGHPYVLRIYSNASLHTGRSLGWLILIHRIIFFKGEMVPILL